MKLKLVALMFVFLILSSSFSVARFHTSGRGDVRQRNIFGFEETGESLIIEVDK